jgi:hypothetical protein
MVRYDFGAIAEVVDLDSREDVIVVTRDLSLSGCFVKTNLPFAPATPVRVRITYGGVDFAATGVVASNTREGMGIEFAEVKPKDRTIIQEWLNIAANRGRYEPGAVTQDRVVKLKNRLSRPLVQTSFVPPPAPTPAPKPKRSVPRLLMGGLIASARKLIAFDADMLN